MFIIKLILWIGGVEMIDLYVALIVAGRRTINKVPANFKEDVLIELAALGLDGNGKPIKTEQTA